MVKLAEYPRTATFSWSHDRVPILATGTASGTVDANFSSHSTLDFFSLLSFDANKPKGSIVASAKFNDLDWSVDNKIVAGALENGVVEFFDPKELSSVANIHKHTTPVKTLKFNSKQSNVLVSGGSDGEIFVWDTNKIGSTDYSPFTAGTAMTPIDEVQSLAWNQSLAHVFASAGSSGYASIWDLKAKKEVIHLAYTSQNTGVRVPLSVVEWHPSNSTRIATATNSDMEPVIMVWDLRNSNAPLKVLPQGHGKGILSLDWCKQDENLLLSGARDNTSILWNPEEGALLTQFGTRGNWVFKSKFAPDAPDLFASASFDSKIIVQTLQNLTSSLDVKASETKQHESEDEFWNKVSENTVDDKPRVNKLQAPVWYGNRSPAAQWAFGGKLVKITDDGKSVSIEKHAIAALAQNTLLDESLKSKDFVKLINKRLSNKINDKSDEDWNLLENLSMDGTTLYLKEALSLEDSSTSNDTKADEDGEEFFNVLNEKFVPQGLFKLDFSTEAEMITESLSKGDLKTALSHCIEKDMLLEAMVIAMTSNDGTLREKVTSAYFSKYSGGSDLARTLYSISGNQVEDLVQNVDVSQWKHAVRFIHTYSRGEKQKNALLVKLGDRLLASGMRRESVLMYLAANSLDSITSIWLHEFTSSEEELKLKKETLYEAHLECLTEFIERFTVLSSYLNKGASLKLTNAGLISKFLEFVNVTAGNGDFDLALKFLNTLPEDNQDVKTEKERVLIASGRHSTQRRSVDSFAANRSSKFSTSNLPAINNSPRLSVGGVLPPVNPLVPASTNTPQLPSGIPLAQPSIPNPTAVPAVPVPAATNPYAPARTQAISQPQPPLKSPFPPAQTPYAPVATSHVPVNPYAPASSASLSQNDPLAPPPITGHHSLSGQTPHLHDKPINGWNDLPSIAKERHTRAKTVNTAPLGLGTPTYGHQDKGIPAPPQNSGVFGSNSAPPLRKTSKPPSPPSTNTPPLPVAMKKTNSYAPQERATTGLNNTTAYMSTPNPAAVPVPNVNQNFVPPSNPYGPRTTSSTPTGIVPPKATMTNTQPPPPPQKPAAGPPPKMSRKKVHTLEGAAAATDLLNSMQRQSPQGEQLFNGGDNSVSPPLAASVTEMVSDSELPQHGVQEPDLSGHVEAPKDQKSIVDFFTSELQRVTPLIPQEYSKQLKDCDKRLNILFKHLERGDLLTQSTIDKLYQIVQLLENNQYADAVLIHKDLATNHTAEAGNWLTGVKRLINIAEATSSQ